MEENSKHQADEKKKIEDEIQKEFDRRDFITKSGIWSLAVASLIGTSGSVVLSGCGSGGSDYSNYNDNDEAYDDEAYDDEAYNEYSDCTYREIYCNACGQNYTHYIGCDGTSYCDYWDNPTEYCD